ncbi:ABC transporter permease [Bacillaceae bacterium Marseille-Q3522]|nr:ABC transporter permease [Bacillaceae bacterium Marseille-Q3522]
MKHLLFTNLIRKMLTQLLLILALLFIFVIMPLAATSIQNAHQQVQSDITYYARGSYDILVRPSNAITPIEKERGLVHENYIGFGEGGISLEQWKLIKERSDIETAAPVASLGYFTGEISYVGIEPSASSTRYIMQFMTTDGVNRYTIGEDQVCILLEKSGMLNLPVNFESIYIDNSTGNFCYDNASYKLPATYQLIVGVDPVEEEALTGIPLNFLKSGWESSMYSSFQELGITDNFSEIPIIELDYGGVNLEADVTIESLPLTSEDTKQYRKQLSLVNDINVQGSHFLDEKINTPEYQELYKKIASMQAENRIEIKEVKIGKYLQPFNQNAYLISKDGAISKMEIGGENNFYGLNDRNSIFHYYLASPLQYEQKNGTITIKKLEEREGIPLYRDLQEKGIVFDANVMDSEESIDKLSFFSNLIDTVKINDYQESLASSPLGIYQYAPVYYIGDGEENHIEMKATITPGSFVSTPASGLTTIEAATAVKGDKPIDAIRVKVAGIDGYTKEAAEKIEKIASEIEELGLETNIVAGASPQKLQVEVEGVGLVEESWTTLGAAGSIVSEWNVTNVILAVLFGIVTIIYLINRIGFWQVSRQQDLLLLQQLGWERKHITKLSRMEMLAVIIIAFLASYPALLITHQQSGLSNHVFLWHGIGFILTLFMILAMIGSRIKQMSEQKKQVQTRKKARGNGLITKNICFFIRYIRSPFIQLLVVSTLSTFVYLSLTETVEQTSVTLLGEYINVQTSSWHVLLIVAAYLLALFTLVESILSLLKIRQKEIGTFRSIGWGMGHILRLYTGEIALWSGIAIAVGGIISGFLYSFVFPFQLSVLLILGGSVLGFYLIVLLVTLIVIRHSLKKSIGDTLVVRRKRNIRKKVEAEQ